MMVNQSGSVGGESCCGALLVGDGGAQEAARFTEMSLCGVAGMSSPWIDSNCN